MLFICRIIVKTSEKIRVMFAAILSLSDSLKDESESYPKSQLCQPNQKMMSYRKTTYFGK